MERVPYASFSHFWRMMAWSTALSLVLWAGLAFTAYQLTPQPVRHQAHMHLKSMVSALRATGKPDLGEGVT